MTNQDRVIELRGALADVLMHCAPCRGSGRLYSPGAVFACPHCKRYREVFERTGPPYTRLHRWSLWLTLWHERHFQGRK